MTKLRYSLDDLIMQLREQGIKSIEEVDYAVLENDGKLSVFQNCSKFYLNVVLRIRENFYFADIYTPAVYDNVFRKKIFIVGTVYKVCLSFSKNRILVHKKNEIFVSMFVVVQNQSRHYKSFTASGCHIKHKMIWRNFFAF